MKSNFSRLLGVIPNRSIKLCSADDGGVAIMFGLMVSAMLLFFGSAVDIGRWSNARSETQSAVDSAVLAGARRLQINPIDVSGAIETAKIYYKEGIKSRFKVSNDTVNFRVSTSGNSILAEGSAFISTPFLAFASVKQLPLLSLAGTEYSEAVFGSDAARYSLEVAVMLDVTGSMSGQPISDLKLAAKDLVDILVWDEQGENYSKVALAPFSDAVRPGPHLNQVRGARPNSSRFQNNEGHWQNYKLSPCVSERDGNAAYTDAAPIDDDKLGPVYTRDGSCDPSSEIVPLTVDKVRLKAAIDKLRASGYSAGHLGTAWAWYLISPNWSSVWPATSAPAAYSDASVKKVAILMSDGEYNLQYDAAGIATREHGRGSMNGLSDAQARQVCDNMKATGIEVYTVGFKLREAKAIETMTRCASRTSNHYLAADGEQLKQAFRDIAIKLSPIYLAR